MDTEAVVKADAHTLVVKQFIDIPINHGLF